MFTRRKVLQICAVGVGATVLGGVGIASRRTRLQFRPNRPLRSLSEREFAILGALAARICPGAAPFPDPAAVGGVEHVDELLANAHPGLAGDIKKLAELFENALANFVFDARARPFTQLSPAEQDRAIAEWQGSSLTLRRMAYKALRGLVVAAYFASPDLDFSVGYPGPPDFPPTPPFRSVEPAMRLSAHP
jgi:hypothetical protein